MAMIDPEQVDWQEASDLEVQMAASAGIKQAIDEAKSRGLTY